MRSTRRWAMRGRPSRYCAGCWTRPQAGSTCSTVRHRHPIPGTPTSCQGASRRGQPQPGLMSWPTSPGAESRYLQLLGEVVADERITLTEAAELESCARTGGLTQIPLEHLHRQAFFHVLGPEVS